LKRVKNRLRGLLEYFQTPSEIAPHYISGYS